MSDCTRPNSETGRSNSRRAMQWLLVTIATLFTHGTLAQSGLEWEVDAGYGIQAGTASSSAGAADVMLSYVNTSFCDNTYYIVPGSAYFYHEPTEPVLNSGLWIFTAYAACRDEEGQQYGGNLYTATAPVCTGGSEMPPCGQQHANSPPPSDCVPPPPEVKVTHTTNPCDPASGNKSQAEVDYSSNAVGGLSFTRYYNSSGPFKTGYGMHAGWRHTYSRAIDEEPDRYPTLTFAVSGGQSSNYSTASDACTTGWDDI